MESSGAFSNQEVKSTDRIMFSLGSENARKALTPVIQWKQEELKQRVVQFFDKFSYFYMRKSKFFIIRHLIINFNTLF